MTRLKDIIYEHGKAWVHRGKDSYTVFVIGCTHSVSDSSYPRTADGLSLAICRADYLAPRPARVPHLPVELTLNYSHTLHRVIDTDK